jgi:hypothetical protein
LPSELSEAHVGDGLGQMVVLQHASHVHVFEHHNRLGFRQLGGHLMQRVGPLIRHLSMLLAKPPRGFLAVLAALHLA